MNAPMREPARTRRIPVGAGTASLLFVAAVAALFALAVVAVVITFATPADPWPWVGSGFFAALYLFCYLLLF